MYGPLEKVRMSLAHEDERSQRATERLLRATDAKGDHNPRSHSSATYVEGGRRTAVCVYANGRLSFGSPMRTGEASEGRARACESNFRPSPPAPPRAQEGMRNAE